MRAIVVRCVHALKSWENVKGDMRALSMLRRGACGAYDRRNARHQRPSVFGPERPFERYL